MPASAFQTFRLNFLLLVFIVVNSCSEPNKSSQSAAAGVRVIVLGTLQDAGSPQAGCNKVCCRKYYGSNSDRKVVSLGLIDPENKKRYLFEAGPDFVKQLHFLNKTSGDTGSSPFPDGIFITHAHIGHYSGLMFLGKESANAPSAKVFAMPRLKQFFESNGPWDQLCRNKNIKLESLKADSVVRLSKNLSVQPIQVPHRDEYSETVAFLIRGPEKILLFIPDIDKWEKWNRSIVGLIRQVDYALIDGTFYGNGEVPGRDLSEIPHPFVTESMKHFENLSEKEKQKVYFIHLNHSNPLLDSTSSAYRTFRNTGFNVAKQGQIFEL